MARGGVLGAALGGYMSVKQPSCSARSGSPLPRAQVPAARAAQAQGPEAGARAPWLAVVAGFSALVVARAAPLSLSVWVCRRRLWSTGPCEEDTSMICLAAPSRRDLCKSAHAAAPLQRVTERQGSKELWRA